MKFQEIEIRGIKLKVWYTKDPGIDEFWSPELDIHSIQLSDTELYDFCEYYNILPDVYEQLWKKI